MEHNVNLKVVSSEIFLRVLSALILISVTVIGTSLGGWYFATMILIVALLMSREWYRLTQSKENLLLYLFQCACIVLAIILTAAHYPFYAFLLLLVGFIGILLLSVTGLVDSRVPLWMSLGCLYIGLPSIAMIWFREDATFGFVAVLYLYILTWSNDSAAFFGGKLIGGVRLFPAISPNKTWAGFITGILAGVVVGLIFALLHSKIDILWSMFVSVLLGIAVPIGDLTESALKRKFGIKDSGGIIPGHGGILDRVDGMVASVCLAAAIALCIDSTNPGAALLMSGSVSP